MQKLYLMCGLSFSGKTYIANEIAKYTGATIIALDKINEERGLDSNQEISISEWEKNHQIVLRRLDKYLREGKTIIIDDTNPLLKLRNRFRQRASQKNIDCMVIYIDTPLNVIKQRILSIKKTHYRHIAPAVTLDNLIKIFEKPDPNIEIVLTFNTTDNLNNWIKMNF